MEFSAFQHDRIAHFAAVLGPTLSHRPGAAAVPDRETLGRATNDEPVPVPEGVDLARAERLFAALNTYRRCERRSAPWLAGFLVAGVVAGALTAAWIAPLAGIAVAFAAPLVAVALREAVRDACLFAIRRRFALDHRVVRAALGGIVNDPRWIDPPPTRR